MSLIRRIARPALAAPFIVEGVRTAITPDRAEVAPGTFDQVDGALEKTSTPAFVDTRTLLRVSGAVAATAGVLFAVGKSPRAAATVLLLTTTVGVSGRKKVWELKGTERTEEIQSILKDVALLGAVMIAAVDRDGKPSFAYQLGKYRDQAQKSAEKTQHQIEKKADDLSKKAEDASKKLTQQLS